MAQRLFGSSVGLDRMCEFGGAWGKLVPDRRSNSCKTISTTCMAVHSCPQGKKRCNTSCSPLHLQLGILSPLLCFGYKNGRRSCDVLHKQCGIFRHTHHFWREFGRVLLLYSWLISASFIKLLGPFWKFTIFGCNVKDALFVCYDTCNQF